MYKLVLLKFDPIYGLFYSPTLIPFGGGEVECFLLLFVVVNSPYTVEVLCAIGNAYLRF